MNLSFSGIKTFGTLPLPFCHSVLRSHCFCSIITHAQKKLKIKTNNCSLDECPALGPPLARSSCEAERSFSGFWPLCCQMNQWGASLTGHLAAGWVISVRRQQQRGRQCWAACGGIRVGRPRETTGCDAHHLIPFLFRLAMQTQDGVGHQHASQPSQQNIITAF